MFERLAKVITNREHRLGIEFVYPEGYALCRWPLLGHCGCPKLSFERPAASILLPRRTILVPWGTLEDNRSSGVLIDFGTILVPHFESSFGTEAGNSNFFSGLLPGQFFVPIVE